MRPRINRYALVAAVLGVALLLPITASAQQKGGNRAPSTGTQRGRLDTLENDFDLSKDQRKAIKTILDDAYKTATPVREALIKAHADIGAAVQANKPQAELDAALKAYAEQATAMTSIEIKALADVFKTLTEGQRANNSAISRAFFLIRGAFVEKKWDDIPEGRVY